MNASSVQNFTLVLNSLWLISVKVYECCDQTVLARDQPLDIFMKESSIKFEEILVQGSTQSNHVSTDPPFPCAIAHFLNGKLCCDGLRK